MDKLKAGLAIALIFAFGAFVIYLMTHLALDDKSWTRATYLFNGVEAIVFAAAGWFFGKEIQRQRAENAEQRAAVADGQARQATEEAVKAKRDGETLTRVILEKLRTRGQVTAGPETQNENALSELAVIASNMFPGARTELDRST